MEGTHTLSLQTIGTLNIVNCIVPPIDRLSQICQVNLEWHRALWRDDFVPQVSAKSKQS